MWFWRSLPPRLLTSASHPPAAYTLASVGLAVLSVYGFLMVLLSLIGIAVIALGGGDRAASFHAVILVFRWRAPGWERPC